MLNILAQEVFPAYAGVNPATSVMSVSGLRIPRVCGGEPSADYLRLIGW